MISMFPPLPWVCFVFVWFKTCVTPSYPYQCGAPGRGAPAKVVLSKTADPYRIQGCRDLGAEVVLVDGIAAALPMLDRIEAEEGRRILHPFNDLNMAYGAASCGAEVVEDMTYENRLMKHTVLNNLQC